MERTLPAPPAPAPAAPAPPAAPAAPAAGVVGAVGERVAGGVRRVTLRSARGRLSALLSLPAGTPRAVILAVHGGGMTARYFHAPAHPPSSLLTLGAQLGYAVLAVDRPGYGHFAARCPLGQTLAEQTETLATALADFTAHHETGAGVLLLAHSFGAKLALATAAHHSDSTAAEAGGGRLLGVDISGCGLDYSDRTAAASGGRSGGNWGPLRLYPPGTFTTTGALLAPMPPREAAELGRWPRQFADLAPRITLPVRFTFAQHEKRWRHTPPDLARLAARLSAAARVVTDHQLEAGHNISLGYTARSYHLRALAFLEDCLTPAADRR